MLVGMAPVRRNQRGPGPRRPRGLGPLRSQGCYPYRAARQVRYIPGPKADYNREVILDLDRQLVAAFD